MVIAVWVAALARSLLVSDDAEELACDALDAELTLDALNEFALLIFATEFDDEDKPKEDMPDELVVDTDDVDGGLVPPDPPPHALNSNKIPHADANRNSIKPFILISIIQFKKYLVSLYNDATGFWLTVIKNILNTVQKIGTKAPLMKWTSQQSSTNLNII